MSLTASAPSPPRAVGLALLVAGAAALLCAVALVVAAAGLALPLTADPFQLAAWLLRHRGDPQVERWIAIGGACGLGVSALALAAILKPPARPLHGAARWATTRDLARGGLLADRGIILGRHGGRLLTFSGPEHALLYAPTRTGKGVGVVIPNLLTWPDSVVVLDVKRENWEASAGFRAAHGQEVILFDPVDAQGRTARFNPLGHIDRADPLEVIDELQRIAAMLFPAPEAGDPFWIEAARTGFVGVGALAAETPGLSFTLGTIYSLLTEGDPRNRLPQLVRERASAGRPVSQGAAQAVGDFCAVSENTFSSVRQTLTSKLSLWVSPRVRAATETSDFDLRDLRRRRISVYLATSPDGLVRVAPLFNLLFQQLVDLNSRQRPGPDHPLQVLVLLDEFARLGRAEVLAKSFAYVAGFGLRLLPVLQSPAQLRTAYGADLAEEIIANCAVEAAFAPKELRVAQDLSDRLGVYTTRTRTRTRPAGLADGRVSISESSQRRALMMPQELIQLPPEDMVLIRTGMPPVRARKIVYWRERRFAARVRPPPEVAARAIPAPSPAADASSQDPPGLVEIGPPLQGLPAGASEGDLMTWVERYIDTSARPARRDPAHAL